MKRIVYNVTSAPRYLFGRCFNEDGKNVEEEDPSWEKLAPSDVDLAGAEEKLRRDEASVPAVSNGTMSLQALATQHAEGTVTTETLIDSWKIDENTMISSPYQNEAHYLDLTTLDGQYQLMAQALTAMAPTTPQFAVADYRKAFNWDLVVKVLRDLSRKKSYRFPRTEFYIIVFRSELPVGTDRTELGKLDAEAHREAVRSGQLLKYWFGVPDEKTGKNLATCVWRHREDARKGGAGPGHRDVPCSRHVHGI